MIIDHAELCVYRYPNDGNVDPLGFKLHRVTRSWTDSTATWGALSEAYDKNSFGFSRVCGWQKFDVTLHIENFYMGSLPNNGFMLIRVPQEKGVINYNYHSSDYNNQTFRPKLLVYCITNATIIESKNSNIIATGTQSNVKIVNMQGRLIKTYNTTAPHSIKMDNIPAGIHFAIITAGEVQMVKKISK